MAIYASTSTITTQTVPLIIVDPATVKDEYFLIWDESIGAFVSKAFEYIIDISSNEIDGILNTKNGGTGFSTYDDGDLLVGSNDTLIRLPIGQSGQLLTVENNLPTWKSTEAIPNIKNVIHQTFTTFTTFFNDVIPENSQVTTITIYIEEEYDNGTVIGISDDDEYIVGTEIILPSQVGTYVYAINKEYSTDTTLYFNVLNATFTGSAKVFIEYTIL